MPASPYATRALPYDSQERSPIALVNSHARLPFGNQLRRLERPKVEEPSFRIAAPRCNWSFMSSVPCANHPASWITCSSSTGRSWVTVLDNLNGSSAMNCRPTPPSWRTFRVLRFCPTVNVPLKSGLML